MAGASDMTLFTTAPGFDQPLDLLSACHRRITGLTDMLQKLPSHLAQHGADKDAQQAAERVLKYFDTAGVHHHDDEEQDLFPMLRDAALQQDNAEIIALLEDLAVQHGDMTIAWLQLHPHLLALVQGESPPSIEPTITRFVTLYARHIPLEENFLLPYAERTLSARQIVTLGQAMAKRRNVSYPA